MSTESRDTARDVVINGVPYAPASTAAPSVDLVLRVLADVYMGEGHDPASRGALRVVVADVSEVPDEEWGGLSLDQVAARLARALRAG